MEKKIISQQNAPRSGVLDFTLPLRLDQNRTQHNPPLFLHLHATQINGGSPETRRRVARASSRESKREKRERERWREPNWPKNHSNGMLEMNASMLLLPSVWNVRSLEAASGPLIFVTANDSMAEMECNTRSGTASGKLLTRAGQWVNGTPLVGPTNCGLRKRYN